MILAVAIIIFFFTLYAQSIDDFVFLRRNVTLIQLFDIAILSGLVGLFFSRLFYALLNPSYSYFNPLVFFVVPYFPGLSLTGFLLGGSLAVYMLTIRQKIPMGRIFDVISLSIFPAASALYCIKAILEVLQKDYFLAGIWGASVIIFFFFFLIFRKFFKRSSWRDGTLAIISLATFSVLQLVVLLGEAKFKTLPFETYIFIAFLVILFFSFLIKQFRQHKI